MVVLLLRPVVVVSSVIPRSSYVAMVVDDSVSMKLQDVPGGATRLDTVKQALLNTGPDSFLNQLEKKFKTNLYGFSGGLTRLKDGNDLYGEGRTSDLAGALDETIKRSSGMPLSAVVLATDGASNVPRDLAARFERTARSRYSGVHCRCRQHCKTDGRRTDAREHAATCSRRIEIEHRDDCWSEWVRCNESSSQRA